jgi:hypothetical protein
VIRLTDQGRFYANATQVGANWGRRILNGCSSDLSSIFPLAAVCAVAVVGGHDEPQRIPFFSFFFFRSPFFVLLFSRSPTIH